MTETRAVVAGIQRPKTNNLMAGSDGGIQEDITEHVGQGRRLRERTGRRGFVSPTIFREKGYRFFFFSRGESRLHVHVYCAHGEAKFRLEPGVKLAHNYGLTDRDLHEVREIIERHGNEISKAWQEHFGD